MWCLPKQSRTSSQACTHRRSTTGTGRRVSWALRTTQVACEHCQATEHSDDSILLSPPRPLAASHAGQSSCDSPGSTISISATPPQKRRRCSTKQPEPGRPSPGRQPHAAFDLCDDESAEDGEAVSDPSLPPDEAASGPSLSLADRPIMSPEDRAHYKAFISPSLLGL